MSPWVMVLGVVGIPALALLAWALGFAKGRRIADAAEVQAQLAAYAPGALARDILLDADGRAALALLADGRVFVLRALGDRLVARLYPRERLRLCRRGDKLQLATGDYAFPGLRLEAAAPAWLSGAGP